MGTAWPRSIVGNVSDCRYVPTAEKGVASFFPALTHILAEIDHEKDVSRAQEKCG